VTKQDAQQDLLGQGTELIFDKKSLYSVIAAGALLLALIIFGAVSFRSILANELDKNSTVDTIGDKLEVKYSSTGNSGEIKITEEGLTDAIRSSALSLKNAKVTIEPDGIYIDGKAGNNLLSLPVRVKIVGNVSAGKPDFKVASIESAGIVAPQKISEQIGREISIFFANSLKLPDHLTLTNIQTNKGFMIIRGEISG